MSQIQIRIDEKTKKSAQKVLNALGIDMTTAIKVYLNQIVIQKGIPFALITENGLTVDEEMEILQAVNDAKSGKNVSKMMSAKEAMNYLKGL